MVSLLKVSEFESTLEGVIQNYHGFPYLWVVTPQGVVCLSVRG